MTELKAIAYFLIIPVFMYTNIEIDAVAILTLLLSIDFITAIIREARINPQGITSNEMKIGFASKILVILIPFIVSLVGKGVGIDLSSLANITLSIFILAEAYSIIGNIQQIRTKDRTASEYDAITIVLKKLQEIIKYLLEEVLKKIGDSIKKTP